MTILRLRNAVWQPVTRTLSVLLVASLVLLAGPVRAQTATCTPEPVFDEQGQFDEAAYKARLEQCFRQEYEQRLRQVRRERALTAKSSLAAEATAVLEQDSLALVALYNSTDGPNWIDNTNWLTGPVTTWFGVTVNEGRVAEVQLVGNGLKGTIPPELGNLTSLYVLNFRSNEYISGAIPPELGNLTNLRILDFQTNLLKSIPPELGNLASLEYLDLSYNGFSGRSIPPELGSLANLEHLDLSANGFSGSVPPELGNLSNLRTLILGDIGLTGSIPPELGDLAELLSLGLSDNQLTGSIPPELGNLANLEYLGLSVNQLTGGIPPELGNLAELRSLGLDDNQLTGSIPPELGNLAKLQGWALRRNRLSGNIPPELGNLADLQQLDISINPLSGSLPGELVNLTKLYTFNFDQTDLCVPQDPAFLAWLQGIDFVNSSGIACQVPPPATAPLAYWPLNGTTTDAVNGLQAQLFGGATFSSGTSGEALHFDGKDDFAAVQNHPSLNPGDNLTLAAWFFCENGSSNATGLEKRRSYRLLSLQDGSPTTRWVFDFWNDEGTYYRLTAQRGVTNEAWHHVAATYDGSTVKLYLDGQLDKAERASGAVRLTSKGFELGRRDLSRYFKGKIDEVRLYGRALSSTEVQALYAGEAAAAKTFVPALTVAIEEVPTEYGLEGNYPNPFNPQTEIRFGLPEASMVTLVVYDVQGRAVARLMDGPMEAGYNAVRWQASEMPSGVYLYRLTAGAFLQSRTMVLIK